MGTVFAKCCRKEHENNNDALNILVLGIENSGKTEISFKICHQKRGDYASTKGCRLFETVIADTEIKLIEIGGGSDLRDIWKYYFLDALAVIFVIDASNIHNICESYKIFQNLMAHEFLAGKPFLILANKQDLPESVDCIEICEYLDVEYLANRYRCPCLVEACGNWGTTAYEPNEYDGLTYGIQWLVGTVLAHRQFIMNRINFHKLMLGRDGADASRTIKRPRTGIKRGSRRRKRKDSRPKTAPSSQQAWLKENDNNYLIKRNSIISVKSIPTSTTTERTNNSSTKATTTSGSGLSVVDEAVEVSQTSSSTEHATVIHVSKDDMTLEDLSLSFSVNETNGKALELI
ncbi:LOW QUALITY PROTEIN: ADP-ribosylation factor-like protein 13B [Anopheles merus]|uniref:LOW QUALITY PROTEIN: ADP-ribosylation factor-like protein 13B n=1 Tax=Anopheles merus TaxID=30066 RepID=UPI001BE49D48|nr:LOW QUALITY PROTEIN: ADP-ribosylation factor-like protein 13B [Anopheles merus]